MLKITFENRQYDAIIALNTDTEDFELIRNIPNIPIIAADGAGISILKKGIVPDKVIGDLDSINLQLLQEFDFNPKNIIHISEQETNDFEKVLQYCQDNTLDNVLIIGIHGGLYEHSLNNMSVFSKFSKKMNLTIVETNRYGFCVNQSFQMNTKINEKISLFPISKSLLKTKGLKWNLFNEYLEIGSREGHANISVTNEIEIEILSGEIFVFCNSRFPKLKKVHIGENK
ncbi:MAG: thiamine diphosphokinase [Ignavibacteria bacterium GWF2_33_9]|nr:MAG: thiamine diphosphokinase [Ignavibacteria bacterium GWF2_33_9]